jgi:hypothetical protein
VSPSDSPDKECITLVGKLRDECLSQFYRMYFDDAKALEILHSWRERRVQELEECLREMVDKHGVHSGECFSCDFFVREAGHHSGDCPIPSAEKLLANSEQIRKGAKHE